MAVITRTMKILNKVPRRTRSMPLAERIHAVNDAGRQERDKDDVVILGTGRAVENTLEIAAYLQRKGDLKVGVYTSSVAAVDDFIPDVKVGRVLGNLDDDDRGEYEEDDVHVASEASVAIQPSGRVRWTSCVEIGVRLK
jgi:ribonuclease P/MRP protein subunit POP7